MKPELLAQAPTIMREYLGYMETVKGKSPKTVEEYFTDLRTFFRYLKQVRGLVKNDIEYKNITIDDITLDLISNVTLVDAYEYMNWLSYTRNNKAAARARKASSLRSFYSYLYDRTLIPNNPVEKLEPARQRKSLPKYLTLDEAMELLSKIDGPYKERNYCIVTLFLNCGMRLSELCSLNVTDIRRDNTLRVVGKGNKERTIYLNNACIDAIDAYLKVRPVNNIKDKDKNALFISRNGNRLSHQAVQLLVKKLFTQMGISSQGYSVHKLRHTAATLMYQHGQTDIRTLKEILGHENLNTTEIYTHISNNELRQAIDNNPLANVTASDINKIKNNNEE